MCWWTGPSLERTIYKLALSNLYCCISFQTDPVLAAIFLVQSMFVSISFFEAVELMLWYPLSVAGSGLPLWILLSRAFLSRNETRMIKICLLTYKLLSIFDGGNVGKRTVRIVSLSISTMFILFTKWFTRK